MRVRKVYKIMFYIFFKFTVVVLIKLLSLVLFFIIALF